MIGNLQFLGLLLLLLAQSFDLGSSLSMSSSKPCRKSTGVSLKSGTVSDYRTGEPSRRRFVMAFCSAVAIGLFQPPNLAFAEGVSPQTFERKKGKISYRLDLPSEAFQESQKPVKTHLDEVNLVNGEIKGYQYGITVDPVRIQSLKEFGSPEEVAARVVTAEVNRDGIFEVTLLEDPYESNDGAYVLHYLSVGKRGNKQYFNKIFISDQKLYVLTVQCKEADFETLKGEMKQTVTSFSVP